MSKLLLAGSNSLYMRYPFMDCLNAQRKLGINLLDFAVSTPHIWCDHKKYEPLKDTKNKLREFGITVSTVSPSSYKYSICAGYRTIQRDATIGYFENVISIAKELGANSVSITSSGGCFDIDKKKLWENSKEILKYLCTYAENEGIELILAPLSDKVSPILNSLLEIERMIKGVNSNNLRALLDTNTISVKGESISDWFKTLGDRIALVRFTDGNYNGYRVWGEGCLSCGRYLEELYKVGYDGILSLRLSGERYIENPFNADERNVVALRQAFNKEDCYGIN